jgi:hypothetical protein
MWNPGKHNSAQARPERFLIDFPDVTKGYVLLRAMYLVSFATPPAARYS